MAGNQTVVKDAAEKAVGNAVKRIILNESSDRQKGVKTTGKVEVKKDEAEEAAKKRRREMRKEVATLLEDYARMLEWDAAGMESKDESISTRAKALRARILARHSERGHLCAMPKRKVTIHQKPTGTPPVKGRPNMEEKKNA